MATNKTSYWGYALLTLLVASIAFWGFKSLLPDKIFPELATTPSDHIVVDEMMKEAMDSESDSIYADNKEILSKKDSVADSVSQKEKREETEPEIPNKLLAEDIAMAEESRYLDYFYERLALLEEDPKNTKVRIAYFGDSMTDGDLIVQDIRQFFQENFGGKGIGFVPITSESAPSRISVIHRFSPNWKQFSYMKSYADTTPPFGVNGQVFYAIDSLEPNYVRYSSGQNNKNRLLPNAALYYGRAQTDSAWVQAIMNKDTADFKLTPDQALNVLRLNETNLSKLELNFYHADSVPIYGVNMDTPFGVQVDNFSNRGNSGIPLSQLDTNLMHAFQNSDIHYDLIILHYGTNVMSSGRLEYGWYGRSMERVVQHLRQAFPRTSILVLSIADRSQKYDNEMKTDSAVLPLLKVQKAYAMKQEAGFINLYKLMGGRGSMVNWVEGDPPRANKDYTHFNPHGAKEVAALIYGELEKGFEAYKHQVEENNRIKKEKQRQDSINKAERQEENHEQASKDTVPETP